MPQETWILTLMGIAIGSFVGMKYATRKHVAIATIIVIVGVPIVVLVALGGLAFYMWAYLFGFLK